MTTRPQTLASVLLLGGALSALAWPPESAALPSDPQSVATLAEGLGGQATPEGLESRLKPLCGGPQGIPDLVEALILAGHGAYAAVRSTILACGSPGQGGEVAAQAATRVLALRGGSVRYQVDAAVLDAAVEIGRRRRAGIGAAGGDDGKPMGSTQAPQDNAREAYVEERRQRSEAAVAEGGASDSAAETELSVYSTLFAIGLVDGGYYDLVLELGADAGGTASAQ